MNYLLNLVQVSVVAGLVNRIRHEGGLDSCQHGVGDIYRVVSMHVRSHELTIAAQDGGQSQLARLAIKE
jgi:hypothetical protein